MKELINLENHYLKMLRGEKPKKEAFKRIVNLLINGSCTVCSLPHYRFQVLACTANNLNKIGWVEVSGKTRTEINYIATDKFKQLIKTK